MGNVSHVNDFIGSPFLEFEADGYHLQPDAESIDKGIPTNLAADIDDQQRPYGSAPDLGADEWVPVISVVITTSESGSLVYTDKQGNSTTVQVPVGAVTEPLTLSYTPVQTATGPSTFSFAGHAFDLDAYQGDSLLSGFTFNIPITITMYYSEADVVGLSEHSLMLEYWDGGTWIDAACGPYERHPDNNWLSVPVCHLSRFALFGKEMQRIYLPLTMRN
jgi:hypothetical protein